MGYMITFIRYFLFTGQEVCIIWDYVKYVFAQGTMNDDDVIHEGSRLGYHVR